MRPTASLPVFAVSWTLCVVISSLAALIQLAALDSSAVTMSAVLPWVSMAFLSAIPCYFIARLATRRSAAECVEDEALQAALAESKVRIAQLEGATFRHASELSAAVEDLRRRDEDRAREAKMASRMQRRIVLKAEELPVRTELAFGAIYDPCDNTGGDLYDACRSGKNGCALLSADVSGRGVTAALIAALVKNLFRSKAAWGAKAGEVLSAVNAELLPILGGTEHFVSAFFCQLNLETGTLSYAAAGHPAAILLRRRDGSCLDLEAGGSALGVIEGAPFTSGERQLEEGDRILLFTDGFSSARNYRGEAFGRERVAASLARAAKLPASEAAKVLLADLDAFTVGAARSDDAALLVAEFRSFARDDIVAQRVVEDEVSWPALSAKAASLAASERFAEAADVYAKMLTIEPDDAASLNNLGALHWRLGRKDEAAVSFKAAAAIDPADERIKRNLSMAKRAGLLGKS